MDKLERGRFIFIEEEGFKDADRVLLSGVEHKIIGSQPEDLKMDSNPRIPQAVINGSMTIREVNALRQDQIWFADTSIVAELGGLECLKRYIALITLPKIDSVTGELEELPHLFGFFDSEAGEILTVEDNHPDELPIVPTNVNTHIAKKVMRMYQARREMAS